MNDDGWTRIPIKPTAAMIDAAVHCLDGVNLLKAAATGNRQKATKKEIQTYKTCHRWWAMISAAPLTPDSPLAEAAADPHDQLIYSLNEEQSEHFMEAMLNPKKPTARMIEAAKRLSELSRKK